MRIFVSLLIISFFNNIALATNNFTIVNETDYTFYQIFITTEDAPDWGKDYLEDSYLYPGESFTVDLFFCNDFDLKIVDEDYDECHSYSLYLCDETWIVYNSTWIECIDDTEYYDWEYQDTELFTVVNQTSYDFREIYVSSADTYDWGEDLLGGDYLEAGYNATLEVYECDLFDVKIVDEDGDICVLFDQDICDVEWFIDNDSWLDCLEY